MAARLEHTGRLISLLCLFLGLTTSVKAVTPGAQDSTDTIGVSNQTMPLQIHWIHADHPNVNEFNIWAGYAFDSYSLWGKTPQSTLSQLGIRYNRKVLKVYDNILEYVLEVNLHAQYTYPEFTIERRRNTITGGGFSPLGLQMNFSTNSRLQPFLKTSGGFMFLSQPFPDNRGEKFNFTFGAGGGLELMLSSNASVSLGYRFFHLSNGETGQVNPGIDSSFFYGGITLF